MINFWAHSPQREKFKTDNIAQKQKQKHNNTRKNIEPQ